MENDFFEIKTLDGCRPDYPEDNTVIVKAKDVQEAIGTFNELLKGGKLKVSSRIDSIRRIYHVFA